MIPDIGDRPPDMEVPGYLRRWCLTDRSTEGSVYLHEFLGPDHAFFHDHPWDFQTTILNGRYEECLLEPNGRVRIVIRRQGQTIVHRATDFHYISAIGPQPTWTLVVTQKRTKEWGFLTDFKDCSSWKRFDYFENGNLHLRRKAVYGPAYGDLL